MAGQDNRLCLMRSSHDAESLDLEALARVSQLHPQLVETFVAYGLIEPVRVDNDYEFDNCAVLRVQAIGRLRRDLGINLAGIAVVFDLLERIEMLQRELADLRRTSHN